MAALEHLLERLAREKLHHDVRRAVVGAAEIEHIDDVGVRELGGEARLGEKATLHLGTARDVRMKDLDGNLAPDEEVLRLPYVAGGAFAEEPKQPILSADGLVR